jgi:hypothetical protein
MALSDYLRIAAVAVWMTAGMVAVVWAVRWVLRKLPLRNPAGEPTLLRQCLVGLGAVALALFIVWCTFLLAWNPRGDAM